MALSGKAVMVMWYDVVASAVSDHDHWHTSEHMPERLAIPGFVRGSRWTASGEGPRYFVMYEVDDVETLSSASYLARLNHPTPWTSRIMGSFQGMSRGFCEIETTWGLGLARCLVSLRFTPTAGQERDLRAWLVERTEEASGRAGVAGIHVLRSAQRPPMTAEQRLRGADTAVDWILLVNGYDTSVIDAVAAELSDAPGVAAGALWARYALEHVLTAD